MKFRFAAAAMATTFAIGLASAQTPTPAPAPAAVKPGQVEGFADPDEEIYNKKPAAAEASPGCPNATSGNGTCPKPGWISSCSATTAGRKAWPTWTRRP